MSEKRWLVRAVVGVGVVGAGASIWGFASPMLESRTSTDDLVISEEPPAPPAPEPTPGNGDGVVLAAGEDDAVSYFSVTDDPKPHASDEIFWYLPASTDPSTFPFSSSREECTEEQMRWFRDQGARSLGDYKDPALILSNEADSGGALSVTNIRFENDIVESDLLVGVQCGFPEGIGAGDYAYVELRLDGSPGVFSGIPSLNSDGEPRPVGEIASINISPGEIETIRLGVWSMIYELGPGHIATGRVIADVASPEKGEAVLLDELAVFGPPVQGTLLPDETLVLADQLYTGNSLIGDVQPCSVAEAMAFLEGSS